VLDMMGLLETSGGFVYQNDGASFDHRCVSRVFVVWRSNDVGLTLALKARYPRDWISEGFKCRRT
jgi:hypothetical protein